MSAKNESKRRLRPSAEAGSIHSNAYNFLSAVNTGVDPRTGMYSCSISLPGVAANNLCGPTVGLSLSFSALDPVDAGFGIGWSLTTTRYDTVRMRLSLSTGESFLIDDFDVVNDTATFKDRKLRSFDLIQESSEGYRVVHKAGHSELLTVLPGSDGVAVLHELRSPEGYVVRLDQQAAGGIVKLREITDGTGQVLLSVAYELEHTQVTLHPASPQAVAFNFHFTNHWLTGVDLPKGYGDGWTFGYEARRGGRRALTQRISSWFVADDSPKAELGLLLLTNVTVPTGGYEEVTYSYEGHALPGGSERPLTHMPYVTRFLRHPGHDQPDADTGYTYSSHNFFGFGVLNDWLDGEDNLYRVVMPPGQSYEYSSIETLYDGGEPVRTIARTFNRFHLLTTEVTTQEDCIKTVVTVYDEDPGAAFADQVSWCQLPMEVHTQYRRAGGYREDVEFYTHDTDGNRVSHRDTDGAYEEYTYYLVGGEDGCPADPLGFRRCLKQKRVTPPEGTEGAIRLTRHRYDLMPSLIEGAPGHLVTVYEGIHHEIAGRVVEIPLSETTHRYVMDGGADHGRLAEVVTIVGGISSVTAYGYAVAAEERNARGDSGPVLVITETLTADTGADDALSMSTRSALSLYSGMNVMDESPDGVVTRYAYDALGRSVGQSMAENTLFAAATTLSHVVSRLGSSQMETSVTGMSTRTELDGFGRAFRRIAVDWLGDGNDREIWLARYDSFGRLLWETVTDHAVPLASGGYGSLSSKTQHVYDAWGNETQSIGADGVVAHTLVDPIERTEETWIEAIATGELSGRSRTRYGKDGRPSRIEHCDVRGTPQWWQSFVYDGWGRRLSDTESAVDAPDKVTRHHYDEYDRIVETVLPDDSVVYRTYAVYTDEALVETIGVRYKPAGQVDEVDAQLGRQVFDGLGRRTLFRSGKRDTRYLYRTSRSAEPDEVQLTSGEVLSFTYERQLGHQATSISDRAGAVMCRFGYHALLGQLEFSSSALGRQETDYFPSGKVKAERFYLDTENVRQTTYAYTLLGMTTSYTSVDGETTDLRYDELGRVTTQSSETLTVAFEYDALSRTTRVRTASAGGEQSMDVSLAYDEYDREIERTLVARSGLASATQTLVQAYTASSKLRLRTWTAGNDTRAETYDYDNRGRLVHYGCTGSHAPEDISGAAIASQHYTFDVLDNIRTLETTYADAGVAPRKSTFHHSTDDPTQLIRVEHLQGGVQEVVSLEYDDNGNLKYDEVQRNLIYDPMGRLARWAQGESWQNYRYDSLDRVGAVDGPGSTRFRYYRDGQVASEIGAATSSSFHTAGGACVAQSTVNAAGRQTILLGGDAQGSVVSEAGATLTSPRYDIYGYRPDKAGGSDIAYAGELREREVGWYFLASFRAYNPVLMRFHSPDPNCPFGHGGLNAYGYVSGDPVNRIDPSGEAFMEWLPLLIGGIGTAIGVGLSLGALGPAFAGFWGTWAVSSVAGASATVSTGLGIVSTVSTGISIVLRKYAGGAGADVLGWMSAYYGVGSALMGIGTVERVATAVSTKLDKVQGAYRKVKTLSDKLQHAGGKPSKPSDIGTRGAPRPQARAAQNDYVELPQGPGPNLAGVSGTERLMRALTLRSLGRPTSHLVTRNMLRTFPQASRRGFHSDPNYVSTILNARGNTAPRIGELSRADLRLSGFDDEHIADLIEGMRLPTSSLYERHQLVLSAAHFRRFVATNDLSALHDATEALRLARDGMPTHQALPPFRRS